MIEGSGTTIPKGGGMSKKVLVINTGGTIGMVNSEPDNPLSPLRPATTWDEVAGNQPILKFLEVETDYYQFDPLLDSTEIRYENWKKMAEVIAEHYNTRDGFVILHGTDTMCYTASALSFMLENLDKPVIVTGSQVPMIRPRSDAVQNLVTAIQIAGSDSVVPEVCIFFRDHLLRGNRSRKLSSSGYSGFVSPNYPEMAKAGEHIEFNSRFIRQRPPQDQEFYASTFLDTHVMVLEIFPGFDPQALRNIFKKPSREEDRIKALVLKTFGAGNAPTNREFMSAIEAITKEGTIVVDVTQCPEGMVELGLYEASSGLLNRGVISGLDITPESAVTKLMYLLGKGWPREEVRRVMQLDLRGEQSLNVYNVEFEEPAKANPTYQTSQLIPGDIDLSGYRSASIRFQDVRMISAASGGDKKRISVKVFLNFPNANADTPDTDPHHAASITRDLSGVEDTVDLFADASSAVRRLVRPGQMATFTIVTDSDGGIKWEKMSVSIYTNVG
jgi:L-asparaginase